MSVAAQTGSIALCTAHPKKGDLLAHDGLTADQEEYQEQAARAQLGAILFGDSTRHRFFSKQLMHFADPHFRPSPPDSPWRPGRKKKPKRAQPRRDAAAFPQPCSDEEQGEEDHPEESRNLADMAGLWNSDSD